MGAGSAGTPGVVGERIGPYRIVGSLGAGGMGVVYRAAHTGSGEEVAVKTVMVPREGELEGIRREARALMGIRHPGVVRILAEGVEGGVPWIATELLQGSTLEDALRETWSFVSRHKLEAASTSAIDADATGDVTREVDMDFFADTAPLPDAPGPPEGRHPAAGGKLPEMLAVFRDLCEALAFIHGEGIVHRDLKPANVFLRAGGAPVLMDFGIARRFPAGVGREEIDVTPLGVGTPQYMAPEQIRGEITDARADLYALGCMLYEAVTGEVPFRAPSLPALLQQHLQSAPAPPSRRVAGVPPELDALILGLLEKRPRDRIGYAADVASALAPLAAPSPLSRRGAAPRAYVYRPSLTGRDDVLRTVEVRLRELSRGRGGALLLRGASGIGKTSVAMAAARAGQRRGATVVAGACAALALSEFGLRPRPRGTGAVTLPGGAALHPFRPLLRAAADRCLAGGGLRAREMLGERAKILAACAPWMGQLPGVADLPSPPELPAQANLDRLLNALREVMILLTRPRGLVLILDDLQWADEVSLRFLSSLPASLFQEHPVLILGAYRSEETSPALEALEASPPWSRVELQRLDARGVGAMVGEMLALAEPPEPLVRFLAEQSEGNPFHVAEYLRAAVAEGLLQRGAQGAWQVAGGGGDAGAFERLPLPRSLRELIARHLAALPGPARELSLAASVLGREAEVAVLLEVADAPEHVAASALQELLTRELLEESAPGQVRFLHDRLREGAYEALAPERRRALHRRAALALEARGARAHGAEGEPPPYERLAHHFRQAGDGARAMEYLEKAGEQALKVSANRQAQGLFRELVAMADAGVAGVGVDVDVAARAQAMTPEERARRARWERRLIEAALAIGDADAVLHHAERALAWAGLKLPDSSARWTGTLLASLPVQAVHRLVPRIFEVRDLRRRGLLAEASAALATMGEHLYFTDGTRALAAGLWSANLGEQAGGGPHLTRAYAGLGVLLGTCRMPRLARHYFGMSRAAAEQGGDVLAMGYTQAAEAVWHIGEARWEAARALCAQAVEGAARLGARYEQAFFLTAAFSIELHPGRLGAGLSVMEQVLRLGEEIGNPQVILWGLHGVGFATLCLGRVGEAEDALRRADTLIDRTQGAMTRSDHATLRAAVCLERGEDEGALAAADALWALLRDQPSRMFVEAWSAQIAADVYLTLCERAERAERAERGGRGGRASRTRRTAAEVAQRLQMLSLLFPMARPYALRARARLRCLDGDAQGARRAWLASIAAAARLGMPYDEALAHADMARAEPPGSSGREEHARRAAALFRQVGSRARGNGREPAG